MRVKAKKKVFVRKLLNRVGVSLLGVAVLFIANIEVAYAQTVTLNGGDIEVNGTGANFVGAYKVGQEWFFSRARTQGDFSTHIIYSGGNEVELDSSLFTGGHQYYLDSRNSTVFSDYIAIGNPLSDLSDPESIGTMVGTFYAEHNGSEFTCVSPLGQYGTCEPPESPLYAYSSGGNPNTNCRLVQQYVFCGSQFTPQSEMTSINRMTVEMYVDPTSTIIGTQTEYAIMAVFSTSGVDPDTLIAQSVNAVSFASMSTSTFQQESFYFEDLTLDPEQTYIIGVYSPHDNSDASGADQIHIGNVAGSVHDYNNSVRSDPVFERYPLNELDLANWSNRDLKLRIYDSSLPAEGTYTPNPQNFEFTNIISLTPNGTTHASTTPLYVAVQWFITPDDYQEETVVRLYFRSQASIQTVDKVTAWETAISDLDNSFAVEIPVSGAGLGEYSTTTDISTFSLGRYSIVAELVVPQSFFEKLFDWNRIKDTFSLASGNDPSENDVRKVQYFIIDDLVFYDTLYDDVQEDFFSEVSANVCAPLSGSFDFFACLRLVILPTSAQWSTIGQTFMANTARVFPLGYITRFLEITTGAAATQPPALTYTFGTASPEELQDKSFTFQIWDNLDLLTTIEADDGSGKNIWDIVGEYFDMIIALGVLGVILSDVMKLGVPQIGGSVRQTKHMKSGEIPVEQLPDQTSPNSPTYGRTHNLRIVDNTNKKK